MKKILAILTLTAVGVPAWPADAPAPALDKLVACADIPDATARLACFEREITPLARGRTTLPPTPTVAAPVPPPAPASTGTSFGQEQLSPKTGPGAPDEQTLHARITSLREVKSGTYVVYLDNGQAWRHEDEHQGSYLREGEAITIGKAAMGSYRLTRDAGKSRNWIRVTRIR
jgi:hypothetical protein